ncbi:MAG: hypothetical protein ACI9GY_000649, partial [Brevundimonas sp.]
KWRENMLSNVTGWIKKLTEAGVGLVALAVVVQVIFGSSVSFLPGDVVARLTDMIGALGGAGLVGLITAGLLYTIFSK